MEFGGQSAKLPKAKAVTFDIAQLLCANYSIE